MSGLSAQSEARSGVELDSFCEWEQLPEAPQQFYSRTGHTMAAEGDCLYIFGGTNYSAMNNELWRLHPQTGFQLLKYQGDPISARSSCKCATGEGNIYLYGGYQNRKDNCFEDFFIYSVGQNSMKKVELAGGQPPKRFDHSMVKYKNYLFVFGGCDDQQKYSGFYKIDIQEKSIQ